jgi:arsenate reductase-like glutaredoxin family protein
LLSQQGVAFDEREIFKQPLSAAELRALLRGRPVSDVFATRSPTYKKLGLAEQDLDDEAKLRLMVENPTLIRRPLVTVGDELVVGLDAARLEVALR